MENRLFIRPYFIENNAAGLCNQLTFIINSILYCSKHNISQVIISDFVTDNLNLIKMPIQQIINIQLTNIFLQKYRVSIIDITSLKDPIDSDFLSLQYANYNQGNTTSIDSAWIDKSHFFDIYNNMIFQDRFYQLSNNLIKEIEVKLGSDIKINVIHLRVEIDAIEHWSRMNNMDSISFNKILEKKYIYLINKFINKHMFTIVMTYSRNNNVIKYLQNNKYNYYIKQKNPLLGRECNALQDLILARKMNNFFIGAGGSTFSHFICNSTNKKKTIMIDINNILKPEKITDF